ncbi:prepilin-type N-terminal cleavage/methylation domain-containing protein [Sphingomonas koreensis]|uniref:type II secretion system protein GspJ n=1 Tax=Sphingomonas koreensis TaxID=93064 RepID=UPI0009FDA702|nr:type II secretion system protein GspJ [Sphingomonas koreensis]PJI90613.1 general secretion pathway protein J [Sphingomonas koreensis]RSU57084.1 prepilin-type N-terminal cleavage/methylation domain-containing protein [Sphingomonas koreensis]RSU65374.1 prepilin-type N-terminal cleavage/methylation domain-containing protein [Sphingomonas koreensis]
MPAERHRPAPPPGRPAAASCGWPGGGAGRCGPSDKDSGFTLLELIISLGLFALIAVAGLGLLDSVLNVQGRTEERLNRLSDLQRAMFVVQSDLDQITRGAVSGGDGGIAFTRIAGGQGGPPMPVRYDAAQGALVRSAPQPQLLLQGVAGARWRFRDEDRWVDRWPVNEQRKDEWPRAVSLEMQIAGVQGPQGALRRVVVLPDQPRDK